MASKRPKAVPTDDELGELFEGIGDDTAIKKSTKARPAASKPKADEDILAELENQLGEKPPSRPHTPRVRDPANKPSPATKRAPAKTPPPGVDTAAAARKSAESSASHEASSTPSASSSEVQEAEKKAQTTSSSSSGGGGGGGGGSWWGGILSTATAAMKQAEAAVKEIQQREEAKKWADQVRGNVGALRGLGSCLHSAMRWIIVARSQSPIDQR